MFNGTIIVVRQPAGHMVLAFDRQYVEINITICFTYYIVLSTKNNIPPTDD